MRPSGRAPNELRNVALETNFSKYAEGSCLAKFGDTHVLCTASVEDSLPPFLRNSGRGWVTAEYGMLPRATNTRNDRKRTMTTGRTQEIQRLIGRSLRSVTDMGGFGERQIRVDCDVLQADENKENRKNEVLRATTDSTHIAQVSCCFLNQTNRFPFRIFSTRRHPQLRSTKIRMFCKNHKKSLNFIILALQRPRK